MTAEWREVRLGDLVDLLTGYPFQSKSYVEDAFAPRLLRGDNVGPGSLRWEGVKRWPEQMAMDLNQYWLREGDVVLAMDRPWIEAGLKYASVRRSDLPSLLVQRVARLRGTTDLETSFLRYLIGSAAFTKHILGVQTGTTVPHISPSQIKSFLFRLPPVHIQRAIAHILGTLDDKIDLLRRMNQTLEETARTLFKSWFVDFDPVRAKAAGRKPVGLDTETAKLFPRAFARDDLPEAPEGWTRAALASWATALSGGTPSKSNPVMWDGSIPWISPKVMKEIHADESDDQVTPEAIGNGTRLAPAGTTLVMVRGMGLHRGVRISQTTREVAFNQDVKALVPRGIEPDLLFFALLDGQQDLLGKVESSGHGTGVLASEILLAHPITMPARQVQQKFAVPFEAINARIAANRRQIRTLAETRDTLLPKLLSGSLRIPDVERFLSSEVRS
ncbi:MAG: restriction endonuclease subunit S [Byssovorax sp.]